MNRLSKKKNTKNMENVSITNDTASMKANPLSKKLARPPPLHIHNQTIKDTLNLVKGAEIDHFEIRRVTNDKHSVIVNSMEDYTKVNELLKEVNTQYFTYTPKTLKHKSLVLRGLTDEENITELKEDLESNEGVHVSKVIQMTSKRPTDSGKKLPLYIIQFETISNMANIYKIKQLNYQRISWESLKKQNQIMQCHKCQRFGHAAINCHLIYRCVKCSGQHNPGECTITTKIDQQDIYCANCQKIGHPASFKGCPIYQQMLEKLRKKIKEKQRKPMRTFTTIPVNAQNGTFADILKSKRVAGELTVDNLALKIEKMAHTIEEQSAQITQLLQLINSL